MLVDNTGQLNDSGVSENLEHARKPVFILKFLLQRFASSLRPASHMTQEGLLQRPPNRLGDHERQAKELLEKERVRFHLSPSGSVSASFVSLAGSAAGSSF